MTRDDGETPPVPTIDENTVPVTWKAGQHEAHGVSQVVAPTAAQVEAYRDGQAVTCAQCWYFDLKNGQVEMRRQHFAERLVREQEWKLHHLGAPLNHVGLCGASGGQMATTTVTKACDQFRPRNGRLKL